MCAPPLRHTVIDATLYEKEYPLIKGMFNKASVSIWVEAASGKGYKAQVSLALIHGEKRERINWVAFWKRGKDDPSFSVMKNRYKGKDGEFHIAEVNCVGGTRTTSFAVSDEIARLATRIMSQAEAGLLGEPENKLFMTYPETEALAAKAS
jgi:hypothetical protein